MEQRIIMMGAFIPVRQFLPHKLDISKWWSLSVLIFFKLGMGVLGKLAFKDMLQAQKCRYLWYISQP